MTDSPDERSQRFREQARKPVHISAHGLFIGDDEFPYPILRDSVKVQSCGSKYNQLTVTMLVGDVLMERRTSAFPDLPEAEPSEPAFEA